MREQVYFLNMFPDYEPPEGLQQILSQAAIIAADIDPAKGSVALALHSECYIAKYQMDTVISDLKACYGLRDLVITLSHPAHQLSCIEPDELMMLFVEQNSMHRGALAGAQWHWDGDCLTVPWALPGSSSQTIW